MMSIMGYALSDEPVTHCPILYLDGRLGKTFQRVCNQNRGNGIKFEICFDIMAGNE